MKYPTITRILAAPEPAGYYAVHNADEDGWGGTSGVMSKEQMERYLADQLKREGDSWGVRALNEELLKASSRDRWTKGARVSFDVEVKVKIR